MARTTPNLQALDAWLAEEERKKRPAPRRLFRNTQAGIDTAELADDGTVIMGRRQDADRTALQDEGYEWLPGDEYGAAVAAHGQPHLPGKGQLPFISNTPTHPAPRGYSNALPTPGDPGMAAAMAKAASAKPGGAPPPAAPARRPAASSAKGSREVQVGLTSQGVQAPFRAPTDRPYSAPAAGSAGRFIGLPEGVAKHMSQRSGLGEVQADANRRALGVALASAFNRIASGISGARYDDKAWEGQRNATGQPVTDYLMREDEERRGRQEQRLVDQDERAAQEAAREAELAMQRFQYGQQRDRDEDALARERMKNEKDIANARLRSEALDRAQRELEAKIRAGATQSEINERARLNRELRQQGVDEKDLQKLAERSQPGAEMAEDISYLNSIIQQGGKDFDAIPGVGPLAGNLPEFLRSTEGDKVAQAASRLAANIILAKSGKAATDAERKFLLASYGIKPGTTEDAWTEGIKALARDAQVSMQNIEAGFRPEIVLERANRGGTTASGIPGPVSMPTGEEIDMPDGSVYEVLEDGTTRRKR